MHELSICGSIADIVNRHADGRQVEVINLKIGRLRQIVPDTLVYCWGLVSAQTALAGSRLQVEEVPARLDCQACGEQSELVQPVFRCPQCDATAVRLIAGEEFLITSLELAEA